MTCFGEGLASVKLKWLCFSSSSITEQNLIWYVEKLLWKFISIPIALFPFPYFYSLSHDKVIVTPIPTGIPTVPIPMHISSKDAAASCMDDHNKRYAPAMFTVQLCWIDAAGTVGSWRSMNDSASSTRMARSLTRVWPTTCDVASHAAASDVAKYIP